MNDALGLMGQQQIMFAIMIALGVAGIGALFFALYVPARWKVPYSAEIIFAIIIAGLGVYGALSSQAAVNEYWADVPRIEEASELSGKVGIDYKSEAFDKAITAYLYQWGMIFINPDGSATRNAMTAKPGEKILVHVTSNDVIHGFQIPAVNLTTEVDPKAVRSVWFRAPKKPGKYLIQCIDYCGVGHYQMKAWLVVKGEHGEEDEKKEEGHG